MKKEPMSQVKGIILQEKKKIVVYLKLKSWKEWTMNIKFANVPDIEDSDMLSLKSIHEPMKRLSDQNKALLKIKLQELMYNLVFSKT